MKAAVNAQQYVPPELKTLIAAFYDAGAASARSSPLAGRLVVKRAEGGNELHKGRLVAAYAAARRLQCHCALLLWPEMGRRD